MKADPRMLPRFLPQLGVSFDVILQVFTKAVELEREKRKPEGLRYNSMILGANLFFSAHLGGLCGSALTV
jgi:hypothetical protein